MYDVLRADRCISVNSLEARVPFGDLDFVQLRHVAGPGFEGEHATARASTCCASAFAGGSYLPEEILWREKAAFSDAVGHSMVDYLKAYAEAQYTDEAFERGLQNVPLTPSPLQKSPCSTGTSSRSTTPAKAQMIVDFWMPNKDWEGCDVDDPSARVLSNYGDSGK